MNKLCSHINYSVRSQRCGSLVFILYKLMCLVNFVKKYFTNRILMDLLVVYGILNDLSDISPKYQVVLIQRDPKLVHKQK